MYHCNLTVHIFSCESLIETTLRSICPPERFSLSFRTYSMFNIETVPCGDIVIIDLPLEEMTRSLQMFCEAEVRLIFCLERDAAATPIYKMAEDVWFKPLTADDLAFRFRNLLETWKCRKDKWLLEMSKNRSIKTQ